MKALHWLGAAALMYTVSAFGQQWVNETAIGDGKMSLDKDRFERRGNAVTAWVQIIYDQPQRYLFSEKTFDRMERQYFLQCKDKKLIVNSYILKSGDEVIHVQGTMSLDGKPAARPVPEDGIDADAFKLGCGYQAKP